MKILFITRAYPPVVGGIQRQNYELASALSKLAEVKVVANRRGKVALPVFMLTALLRAMAQARHYDVVLLGDGVLGLLGYLLKLIFRKPVICILHGLDVTYKNSFYQKLWVGHFLRRMDRLVAVGNETIRQGVKRDLPEGRFVFIPNGVAPAEKTWSRKDLHEKLGITMQGPVILTLGRLVKRKGVEWFVSNVMPELPPDVSYIIAGDGKEKSCIQTAIDKHGLEKRVMYLGPVSDDEKSILMSAADVFVQPNIHVEGDMEGFGLVVLEAAAYGTAVVASGIEGLKDAIHHNENGILVESGNVAAYRDVLTRLLNNDEERRALGCRSRQYVLENFSWESVAKRYLDVLGNYPLNAK